MPRKVSYGLDYDDGYDDYDEYDDYDYDYSYGAREEDSSSKVDKKASEKPALWRCSICTYDNDETQFSCEICGVLHESSANVADNDEDNFHPMPKTSGVSVLAKSLFGQNTQRKSKAAIVSDDKDGKTRAILDDLHKTFMAPPSRHSVNIAPFRFDTPSPDDIVSTGKNSARINSKGKNNSSTSATPSSTINGEKEDSDLQLDNQISNNLYTKLSRASETSSRSSNNDLLKESEGSRRGDEPASQSLASKLESMKLDKSHTSRKKARPLLEYKPEKWMLAYDDVLTQLNLAIVGHVDSGKSTISGRLLHLLGRVSKKEMHKYEKEAKEKGKGSFAYAWAMDESTEERERGITMTVAVAYFDTKKYRVVLLDSPGHKDFVPNMISGATQADAAVLVVDASIGSFEAGMDGQTREHAQLIRSFGVEQLIVAVNKMDTVEFSRERFDYIKEQLGSFLRTCGFKESFIIWIPLSAMANQNLVESAADRLSYWYKGLCLLDAIDSLQPPVRDVSKPLILPICDVIKSHSLGQVAAGGKLETGAIRVGSKVLVMPARELCTVKTIERDSRTCTTAKAGDNVAVGLQGIDGGHIISGGVLCHPDFPVSVASRLELKILVLDIKTPILVGSQVEFHIHHAKAAGRVSKILSSIDQKTGKPSKKAPRVLMAKQSAQIEVTLVGAVCVEEFSHSRALGRAFLRASGNTIAVGIVMKIIEQQ